MGMIIYASRVNERIKYIKVENHLAKHPAHIECYICYNNNKAIIIIKECERATRFHFKLLIVECLFTPNSYNVVRTN